MDDEATGKHVPAFPMTSLNEQVLALVRIANAMLEATDLDQILSAITREVSRLIEFDRSSIALLAPDGKTLTLRNIHGGAEEKHGEGRQIAIDDKSIVGWVVNHQQSKLRHDISADEEFVEIVTEEPLRSDMVVPMTSRGRIIGTINVGSYKTNAFTETDLEIMENCAKFASLAIEHTMLRLDAQSLGERYKTLQEDANDIILIIDRSNGRLVEVNRKCESALGYPRETMIKRKFFDLFAREDQYQARRDFINIMSQKSMAFVDRRMIGRDGEVIYVDINASLIQLRDEVFVQMIVHDISQRKMLEQQIILQNKNLQEVNAQLMKVDQMKTEFLANISHELRTPLSIIIAYTESLRDPAMSVEERTGFLDVIKKNGASLLRLIDDLLDLSKLEVSGRRLDMSLSHIHDVIKAIWPDMQKRAAQKRIHLSFTPGREVPVTYLDNSQMVRVFACLIQNAIKFTDEDGSVDVLTSCDDNLIRVTVRDTGQGIRPEDMENIFNTFQQVDGSSSRRFGGLGIGLALARHIVELHNGRLSATSEYGVGSEFTASMPVNTEAEFLRPPAVNTPSGVVEG